MRTGWRGPRIDQTSTALRRALAQQPTRSPRRASDISRRSRVTLVRNSCRVLCAAQVKGRDRATLSHGAISFSAVAAASANPDQPKREEIALLHCPAAGHRVAPKNCRMVCATQVIECGAAASAKASNRHARRNARPALPAPPGSPLA